jgi:hypothetical protein
MHRWILELLSFVFMQMSSLRGSPNWVENAKLDEEAFLCLASRIGRSTQLVCSRQESVLSIGMCIVEADYCHPIRY